MRGRLRHAWKVALRAGIYCVIRPTAEGLRRLPVPVARGVGAAVGAAGGAIAFGAARQARANLRRAMPDLDAAGAARIAAAHFRHLGSVLGEWLAVSRLTRDALAASVPVEGLDLLERARREGRGVIVLTGHLGNWEIAAAAVGVRTPQLGVVARDLYDPHLSRFADRLRARFGVETFDTNDARGLLRHLNRGGVLGVLVDQSSRRVASLPVAWFGSPVATPVGPVKLAERTGAMLVSGFIVPRVGGSAVVLELLADAVGPGEEGALMARFNARLEERIRAHPERWVWLHDRWKVVPALAAVLLGLAGCGGGTTPAPAAASPVPQGSDSHMRGVHVRQVVQGRVEVEIWAEEAWHSRAADWVGGRRVRARYAPEHRHPAVLTSTTARYDVQDRSLLATGAVRVESQGAILETSELTYDARQERLTSSRFVRVTRGDNVMTGTGLEADPDLGNLRVSEPSIDARSPGEFKPLVEDLVPPRN